MKRFGIVIFWVLLGMMIGSLNARSSDFRFKHLTIDDGLSQNAIFAILQDRQGFMWFGTKDGLNRYDGYSFQIFQQDPFDLKSLSSSYITVLFEDSRGWLWIGTKDGGLNLLDRETETFIRYENDPTDPHSLSSNEITAIAEDREGNIWVGTRDYGLNRLSTTEINGSGSNFTRYLYNLENSNHLGRNSINTLYFDGNNVAWIGTNAGLDKMVIEGKKVTFSYFPIVSKNKDAPAISSENSVTAIFEDREGMFWLGTPSGLSRFNPRNGKYVKYPHRYEILRFGWGTVIDILEDRNGYLWLATPGELMRFNPANKSYIYINHDPLNPWSISDNSASSIYQDRSGILWFGTSGYGVNIFDPRADRFKILKRAKDANSRIAGFSVRSILEDREGNLWVSTGVLYKWNRKTGELKSFETHSDQLNDFGNTGAWSMIQDRRGNIWLATHQGLYRYNLKTRKVRQYKYDPADASGLKEKVVYGVIEARNGEIWIASDRYFSKLVDEQRGRFVHYRYRFDSPNMDPALPTIFQDEQERFWLGTQNGLLRFDPETKSFITYRNNPDVPTSINNNGVRAIFADPDNPSRILWLGTHGGGLNRFDMETETFSHYTTRDGLPNNVVYGILSDKFKRLWLSTNRGLSRFNPRTGKFQNFDISDGLQSNEFNSGAYFQSPSGEMFFGGINGLNYFYPEKVVSNPYVPNVVITGLRIFNRKITPATHPKLLPAVISQTNEISLSYDQDVITFEFAALNFTATFRNQYSYKLEGFNENWIPLGETRTATFTNLPPGNYVFRVKGSNNDGIWNEQGVSLRIHITPPFWRTRWAYLFYVLIALGTLYGIRHYELNRVLLKNNLKLEQIEREKLRDLDRLKSRFFANISHEFRTPLTLILGQVDMVLGASTKEEERRRLIVALRNARRLLRLINQLLDLSKLEAGSMPIKAQRQNLIPFLKNLVFSFESLAEQKHIDLQFRCDYQSIELLFEPDKLENVFYNLLSNAFKFTPEGGKVTIIVDLSSSSISQPEKSSAADQSTMSAAHRVDIRVSDTGIGIPADQQPHIFDRFYQGDSSYTREKDGSGIGLALVKELVELHGGEIRIFSEEGKETTFSVHLPIISWNRGTDSAFKGHQKFPRASEDISETAFSTIVEQNGEMIHSIPATPQSDSEMPVILVVEDHADVRSYIRNQLESSYLVLEAGNGEEGAAIAEERIPDLIITDIMMPKMDGYQMCKVIKGNEKTCHIPIIMLTAKAGMEEKIEGLETGADDYLLKPFSTRELAVRVQNLINLRRRLRERFREKTVIRPADITGIPIEKTFLEKVFKMITTYMGEEHFDVMALSEMLGMSVSQLNRKLGALLGQSTGRLIRSFRLQRAADLLSQNESTVAEICYEVGFVDQANFTRAFKKQFGMAPGVFRKKQKESTT